MHATLCRLSWAGTLFSELLVVEASDFFTSIVKPDKGEKTINVVLKLAKLLSSELRLFFPAAAAGVRCG